MLTLLLFYLMQLLQVQLVNMCLKMCIRYVLKYVFG